jgi:3'-phosphoadenosine 5'-phosphosulfate sulfotransferase (PAPS reductase)/FAD synthetase
LNCDGRVVVWFSCGAASAVAAKLAVQKYPDAHVVYCDLLTSEHPDNLRFLRDVENWIGKPVQIIHSSKYATIEDVFEGERYMSGIAGAPCTREMKKVPRMEYQLPNDLHIFGLCADEEGRIAKFEKNNPDLEFEWILRDQCYTHAHCMHTIKGAGIELPVMYALGFRNNNCIGCVKATSAHYWGRVRAHFPEIFERRANQSREIGCRLARYQGVRIFLDELPTVILDKGQEEDIECGVICVQSSFEFEAGPAPKGETQK